MRKLHLVRDILDIPSNHVGAVIQSAVREGLHSMTMVIGPKLVIRATQTLVCRKLSTSCYRRDFDVAIGVPNARTRKWIAKEVKAGKCFPMFTAAGVPVPRPKVKIPKGRLRKISKVL